MSASSETPKGGMTDVPAQPEKKKEHDEEVARPGWSSIEGTEDRATKTNDAEMGEHQEADITYEDTLRLWSNRYETQMQLIYLTTFSASLQDFAKLKQEIKEISESGTTAGMLHIEENKQSEIQVPNQAMGGSPGSVDYFGTPYIRMNDALVEIRSRQEPMSPVDGPSRAKQGAKWREPNAVASQRAESSNLGLPASGKTNAEPENTEKPAADKLREIALLERTFDHRERAMERQEREIDRRGRELDRRERDFDRRAREFDLEKARWAEVNTAPQWEGALETLRRKLQSEIGEERRKAARREQELEARLMKKVHEELERERQINGLRMSDNEVNEMVEDTVGYLLQKDEDIADRARFRSLIYLAHERLAIEAGLQPGPALEPLPFIWKQAIGPSVVTEDRYDKAMALLNNRQEQVQDATLKLMDNKTAMEYAVEYTSHLRTEGPEGNIPSYAPGFIPREAYLESVERQVKQAGLDGEALAILVEFVCHSQEKNLGKGQIS
ncbi:hypothetical protein B0H34DRAFT_480667 [Crassisporium funariophilum]|nr:hypothetical protein B0H34DRAFT_480667 [Crassisporium funariophilum]